MSKNPITPSRALSSTPKLTAPISTSAKSATASARTKPGDLGQAADLSAYMPTFAELRTRLGLSHDALKHASLTIPSALLRLLISEVVRRQPFDEAAYLAANPDVAQAVKTSEIISAHEHYVGHGYFEGRMVGPSRIDEAWYLRTNSDVAKAVRDGVIESGAAHYDAAGRREGRVGSAAAGAAKSVWDAALDKR